MLISIFLLILVLFPNSTSSTNYKSKLVYPVTKVNYSLIWGKSYQTENCPAKKAQFESRVRRLYGNAHKEKELRELTQDIASRFSSLGYNPVLLAELLYRIALHESNGGKYTKQINGPARSWFQIEPSTAVGLVKNNPELIIGYDTDKLKKLPKQAMADLLEKRQDIAATIAVAKIIETGERLGTNKGLKT